MHEDIEKYWEAQGFEIQYEPWDQFAVQMGSRNIYGYKKTDKYPGYSEYYKRIAAEFCEETKYMFMGKWRSEEEVLRLINMKAFW